MVSNRNRPLEADGDAAVDRTGAARIPTDHGEFTAYSFTDAQGLEHLVGSLKVSVSGTRVEVGSEHPGAPAAEFGTLQQPPRAWLQPAFQAALAPVRARLRRALKDHLT